MRSLHLAIVVAFILASGFAQIGFKPLDLLKTQHFYGHASPVTATALSSDGSKLVSSDQEGLILVWDVKTGHPILGWSQGTRVTSLAMNADGTSVYGTGRDGTLRQWDIVSGREEATWKLLDQAIDWFKLSPNGQKAIIYSWGLDQILLCDLVIEMCSKQKYTPSNDSFERIIAFSPNSETVFIVAKNQILAIRAADGVALWVQQISELQSQYDSIDSSISLSPDGNKLLVATNDGLKLLKSNSGKVIQILPTQKLRGVLRWSSDGSQFASIEDAEVITIWDAVSLQPSLVVDGEDIIDFGLQGNNSFVTTIWWGTVIRWDSSTGLEHDSLDIGYDLVRNGESNVITSIDRGEIKLTDVRTMQTQTFTNGFAPVDIGASPESQRFVLTGSEDIRLFENQNNLESRRFENSFGAFQAAFSPDGQFLAATTDGDVQIWETNSGKLLTRLKSADAEKDRRIKQKRGYVDPGLRGFSRCLAWSPDGKSLAVGFEARGIGIWDVASGKLKQRLLGHTGWVLSLAWRPDGKQLVSAAGDGTLRFWSPQRTSLGLVQKIQNTTYIRSVAYSPDGHMIASTSSNGSIALWDSSTTEPIKQLLGHKAASTRVAWSPDGKALVSGSSDRTIKIWDVSSGQVLQTIGNLEGVVLGLMIPNDGKTITALSRGSSLKTWGHQDGTPVFGGGK